MKNFDAYRNKIESIFLSRGGKIDNIKESPASYDRNQVFLDKINWEPFENISILFSVNLIENNQKKYIQIVARQGSAPYRRKVMELKDNKEDSIMNGVIEYLRWLIK